MNIISKFIRKVRGVELPSEIFEGLKNSKHLVTEESLDMYYQNASILAQEFVTTKQIVALEKLTFLMSCVEKEKEVLSLGINQFIFRDDIEEFLSRRDIKESSIKLIELADYPRHIPKDIQHKIKASQDIFDKMYVLFTDYTGTVTKHYQRDNKINRIDKDPILFGTFQYVEKSKNDVWNNTSTRLLNDKFYVIGDWVDEYCQLTLDKLIEITSKDIVNEIGVPTSVDEIKKELERIKENEKDFSLH